MDKQTDPTEDEETGRLLDTEPELNVSRRDVMRAAGAAGLLTGYAGTAQASHGERAIDCNELKCLYPDNSCPDTVDNTCIAEKVKPENLPVKHDGFRLSSYNNGESLLIEQVSSPFNLCKVAIKCGGSFEREGCTVWDGSLNEPDTVSSNPWAVLDCNKGSLSHIEFLHGPDCVECPRVENLIADCEEPELTITTDNVADNATLDVTVQAQLKFDTTVEDVGDPQTHMETVSSGQAEVTLDPKPPDTWNQLEVDVELGERTLVRDEVVITEDFQQDPPVYCNSPTATAVANCDFVTVTATNQYAEGDDLNVSITATLGGNTVNSQTTTISDDGSGTEVPVPVSWDTFDKLVVDVDQAQLGLDLFDDTFVVGEGGDGFCHSPGVGVGTNCDYVTVTATNQYAEGDSLHIRAEPRLSGATDDPSGMPIDTDFTGSASPIDATNGKFAIPADWDTFDKIYVKVTHNDSALSSINPLFDDTQPAAPTGEFCHEPDGSVDADCTNVTVTTNQYAIGDQVTVSVDVSTDAGVEKVSSGNLNVSSVNSTTGEAVYAYGDDPKLDGKSWDSVEITVTHVGLNLVLVDSASPTIQGGPCGCPECPDGLEVKFEQNASAGAGELDECEEFEDFVITDVVTNDEGEILEACFTTTSDLPTFCELGVCVKAGRETQKEVVEPVAATFDETECGVDINGDSDTEDEAVDIFEYCVDTFNGKGISHITIICPDRETCPENESPGGGK